jgi:hypothetical protein
MEVHVTGKLFLQECDAEQWPASQIGNFSSVIASLKKKSNLS